MTFAIFLLPLEGEPHISAPQEAYPGDVISIFIWNDGPLEGAEAELQVGGKAVASSKGFPLEDPLGKNHSVFGILLSLPSTQKPGRGSILLRHDYSRNGEGEPLPFVIHPREFISEEIPLNPKMTKLRREADAEKVRQARELYALLTRVNREASYLDTPFTIPLKFLRTSSFYGDRRVYRYSNGTAARSTHTGIDFSAQPGTMVLAAGRGRVVLSENRIITGETVVIEHLPGVYSLYYHLQTRFSKVGDLLDQKDLIGTVGATGLAVGAHLHWEIRVNGIPVDPNPLLKTPLIDKKGLIANMLSENN